MRPVASEVPSLWMLCRAVCWFRELKALLASTSRRASVSSLWKKERTACTAASMPDIWPAHSCEPAGFCASCLVIFKMALAMMCLAVSPILMGQTPGFLSRASRQLDISGAMVAGSTSSVQRRFATIGPENGKAPRMPIWRRYRRSSPSEWRHWHW